MRIEVWSDVVCPWCYIGKRRLESALAKFEHADEVEVVWRSFELDPDTPADATGDLVGHLAAKYGGGREAAESMMDRVAEVARGEDLHYRFDIAQRGNTFDAHRLIHFAADHGLQGEMKERVMEAYFTEGAAPNDRPTLAKLAADVGLDADETLATLASDRYVDEVRTDEAMARELGVNGVPFFVIDRAYGVSGAQDADRLLEVIREAWTESHSTLS